jgi:hypothetical protein
MSPDAVGKPDDVTHVRERTAADRGATHNHPVVEEVREAAVGERSAPALPPVPGTVRLMTDVPIVMPAASAHGERSLRDRLDERPWLLGGGFLALLGFFLLLRASRSR